MARDFETYNKHWQLAEQAQQSGKTQEALDNYEACIALDWRDGETFRRIGEILLSCANTEAARDNYKQAVALGPHNSTSLFGLANAFQCLGEYEESEFYYREALRISPDMGFARWNYSLTRLALGDYSAEAWEDYDAGRQTRSRPTRTSREMVTRKRFLSEDFTQKSLYIYCEQGHGDTLMYLRFVTFVAKRFKRVILEVQPDLLPLLWEQEKDAKGRILGADMVCPPVADGGFAHHCDEVVSIAYLPALCVDGIGDMAKFSFPYLKAQADDRLKMILEGTTPKKRIGICWKGNPGHGNDKNRSLKPEHFAFLKDIPGIEVYSLVPGECPDYAKTGFALEHFGATASLIASLDIVVTVDTAVAHLAGALGKDVYVLIPYAHDWRWTRKSGECLTVWYESMRLFRQQKQFDWDYPLQTLKDYLKLMVN